MLVHRRVTPSIEFAGTHLYTWVKIPITISFETAYTPVSIFYLQLCFEGIILGLENGVMLGQWCQE